MAKRKSKKKSTGRSKGGRRMSGASTDAILPVLVAIGGAVAAKFVVKQMVPADKMKYAPAIQTAAGLLALLFVKMPIVKQLGLGIAVGGGMELAQNNIPGLAGVMPRRMGYANPGTIGAPGGGVPQPANIGGYRKPANLGTLGAISKMAYAAGV